MEKSLRNYIENILSLPLPHLDSTEHDWLEMDITSPLGMWSLQILHEGVKYAGLLNLNQNSRDYGVYWGLVYNQIQTAYYG